MNEIRKNIKENTFHRAYLLYGDEEYLVSTYKKMLKDAICGDDTMNLSIYQGKDIDLKDVGDTCRTMPFFAELRLVVIEDSGMFRNSSEEMTEIVKGAPDTTIFLFTDSEVDKRNRLYKAVNEIGHVCEMKTQSERELAEWAGRIFGTYGKRITASDAAKFVGLAGPDMNNIRNEAMKLVSYTGDSDVITSKDIEDIVSIQPEDRVFDMINAMASHEKDKAIRLYADLMELKEPPVKILALISRQFEKLLAVNDMLKAGAGKKEIASRLGINPYFVGRYMTQAGAYTDARLRQALTDCVNTDYEIKSGITDDKYSVEMLIVKFCKG